MKAITFVKTHYPNATAFPSIDNRRGGTSYVILKHGSYAKSVESGLEILPNEGAITASKAWTNAKKYIQLLEKIITNDSQTTSPAS